VDAQQTEQQTQFNPSVVHLQALLDRARASPGVSDGYLCENLTKAIAGFEALRLLPVDGKLDGGVIAKIADNAPAVQPYEITEEDEQISSTKLPNDYADQVQMTSLGHTSVEERLAERFHMHTALIKALNSTSTFKRGETIAVTIPGGTVTGSVKRIEVHGRTAQAYAFAENGSLLADYPATIGSENYPSPAGKHEVKGVARMPPYTYNPKINSSRGATEKSSSCQVVRMVRSEPCGSI